MITLTVSLSTHINQVGGFVLCSVSSNFFVLFYYVSLHS